MIGSTIIIILEPYGPGSDPNELDECIQRNIREALSVIAYELRLFKHRVNTSSILSWTEGYPDVKVEIKNGPQFDVDLEHWIRTRQLKITPPMNVLQWDN